jgi:hypothetical protein
VSRLVAEDATAAIWLFFMVQETVAHASAQIKDNNDVGLSWDLHIPGHPFFFLPGFGKGLPPQSLGFGLPRLNRASKFN